MQNNHSSRLKVAYITLGALLVVAIALTTVYVLSLVSEPASDQKQGETSLVSQLTDLYRSSNDEVNKEAQLSTPVVQESGTVGYKNARSAIIEADSSSTEFAYFYQTPDETWHFFMSAQDQGKISCSKYNSEELTNAFIGFTCQDTYTNKSSYVEREPAKFEIVPGSMGG